MAKNRSFRRPKQKPGHNYQSGPRGKPCQMCRRPSKGKLKKWHNMMVCRSCYKTLCQKFIKGSNLKKKILRSLPPPKPKGFWESLFGR